jgi:hypothetical protein
VVWNERKKERNKKKNNPKNQGISDLLPCIDHPPPPTPWSKEKYKEKKKKEEEKNQDTFLPGKKPSQIFFLFFLSFCFSLDHQWSLLAVFSGCSACSWAPRTPRTSATGT